MAKKKRAALSRGAARESRKQAAAGRRPADALAAPERLPLGSVLEAARLCLLPPESLEARHPAGRSSKVELLSPWGWPDKTAAEKSDKAREIADLLQDAGWCCSHYVMETAGFDAVFELA